jgi:epoxyqueuosine reductase
MSKEKILIHACCAPCAAPSVERVTLDDYEISIYFSNSNIYPEAEYRKRLEYIEKLSRIYEVILEEDVYDHEAWLQYIRGYENEPEKGLRCRKCFEFNLARTAQLAKRNNYSKFTTTLTLSPHKISKIIFEVGAQFPGYVPYDFKKQHGFIKSVALAKQWEFYRQSYCGCEFSKR